MIGTTISYICKRVDSHLRSVNHIDSDGSSPPLVDLVDGSQLNPLILPLGSISMLVMDVNEDREFRDADRFQRRISTSESIRVENHYPDLHLEIGLLFVAKFKDYGHAWNQLSHVIGFFQIHPCFNVQNDRDLPEGVGRLAAEFRPQSLQQINDLWSALKISPHPAVFYRFRLLTISGPMLAQQPMPIQSVATKITPEPQTLNLRSPPLVRPQSS
ncbi:MAG: Pvc16 family protein [Synechococcaceae cyanobacterium]|nr:Pvc16 family protein [Synechococcaceae cyanobacterium]